ncbi:hypothetical protein EXIGLDRAFT_837741 [Exidia glandulosa HHB12029]|uniref:DUF6533 domain-containing protein n=1 Tax=Exidia glandulosa HHB12029 TaxID=1314781 RepID=A0A165GGN7_EXIGL|nr:hypothetical protein EXIGLDRAFT_837741 [Exidia glandulosa HHB12029]
MPPSPGAYALFVYDWLLCFGQEADFVFHSTRSAAKVAYICCRYWPLLAFPVNIWAQVVDHDHDLCERIFRIPMLIVVPHMGTAAAILILRIYALTGGNRAVAAVLIACFLVVAAYLVWVVFAVAVLNPLGGACVPVEVGTTRHISGIFLGSLLLDCIITVTFLTCLIRMTKLKYTQMGYLTRTFAREGAAYFVAISIVNLVNVAFNMQPYVPLADVNVPWSIILPNLLACRLVLNLRYAASSETGISNEARIPVERRFTVSPGVEFLESNIELSEMEPC